MLSDDEILSYLKDFKSAYRDYYGIEDIGIYNLNSFTQNSRIDVFVKLNNPNLFTLFAIKEELENLLNEKIDLVQYRDSMSEYLKESITNDAISA